MVRDAYFYAVPLLLAGLLMAWLTSPPWGTPAWLLAAFCLWFFRDPERVVPDTPGAIVSPADGKVTDVSRIAVNGFLRSRGDHRFGCLPSTIRICRRARYIPN